MVRDWIQGILSFKAVAWVYWPCCGMVLGNIYLQELETWYAARLHQGMSCPVESVWNGQGSG